MRTALEHTFSPQQGSPMSAEGQEARPSATTAEPGKAREVKIAVIDDTAFFLTQWKRRLLKGPHVSALDASPVQLSVECFLSPQAFWSAAARSPEFLPSLTCAIVDLNFDDLPMEASLGELADGNQNGLDLARELRAKAPAVVTILNSCSPYRSAEFEECFDHCLNKEVLPWERLEKVLKTAYVKRGVEPS